MSDRGLTIADLQRAAGNVPAPRTEKRTKIRLTLDIEQWALPPGELHDAVIDAINEVAYVSNQVAYVALEDASQ